MTEHRWMIYGANGYTGRLVAESAAQRGQNPILAGRSAEKIRPIAQELDLEWIAVDLGNERDLVAAVGDVELVFHAAGPFIHTSNPMIRACLAAGSHYLDITGEVAVFENTFRYDAIARRRGVALLGGVGFDVVPTDCLARYVADRVPDADTLDLAIAAVGSASAGTTKTAIEMLPNGGQVRRDGTLQPFPLGAGVREVQFADRPRTVMPIPWGDLATAYRSTGIPNITTYMAVDRRSATVVRVLAPLLQNAIRNPTIRRWAQRIVERRVTGPDDQMRQSGRTEVWARAASGRGAAAEAWLETGEGYQFTALAALRCIERVLAEQPRGALTPAQAFGPDLVCEIAGVRRFDRLPAG
jgi:short subunit dehydrogenase-like uncharacterized protein